jgi:hypothetical protein
MASSFEPGTPQAAAVAWAEAVIGDRDLRTIWPATDPTLRLVLAQDWVWNHRHDPAIGHDRDWDAIARGLAACPPDEPLWDRFAADVLGTWQQTWRGFEPSAWDVKPQPEIIDLDLELVTFVERETALARRFAMRHTHEGWLVASINGDQLFEPGWPPRLGRAAGQP